VQMPRAYLAPPKLGSVSASNLHLVNRRRAVYEMGNSGSAYTLIDDFSRERAQMAKPGPCVI